MLGFGKKKNKDAAKKDDGKKAAAAPPKSPKEKGAQKNKSQGEVVETVEEAPLPAKKKFITKKRIFILLLMLGAIGMSSFLVYSLYFTEKGPEIVIYEKIELPHVKLPEEMLEFSFNHFPALYMSLVNFNTEITLFDREIARIEVISKRYPEQQKITNTEKKVWEKGKATLIKAFLKVEKPIKETYVLFQVNERQGLVQVKEKEKELTDMATTALETAQAQTKEIKARAPKVPKGIFPGTLYKLKKKFL
jgi:hypothetical protein